MRLDLHILIILNFVYCFNCQNSSFSNFSLVEKSRGAVFYRYSINLFSKVNNSLTLSTFGNSGPIHWKLIKFVNDASSSKNLKSISLPLYNISNPLIRSNQLIRKEFLCKPTDRICIRLVIPTINLKNIGTYSYQSLINNLDTLYVNYNISLIIDSIQFNCSSTSSNSSCSYNHSTQLMSLAIEDTLKLNCSILIAQNNNFEPAIDLIFNSSLCSDSNSNLTKEIIPNSSFNLTSLGPSDNTNIVLYKITKTCIRRFDKEEQYPIECKVVPKIDDSIIPIELLPKTDVYDELNIKLDMQYGPELEQSLINQNRTLIVGINDKISVNFTCPFISKPDAIYYWRLSYVSYSSNSTALKSSETKNESKYSSMIPRAGTITSVKNRIRLSAEEFTIKERVYSLPMNLEIGSYIVECKAESSGVIRKVSEPVRFQLNIIRLDDLWIKKEELEKEIQIGKDEIEKLQTQITSLNEKLIKANEKLIKNQWSRNEFEKIITKTQAAYLKIFETSQKILNIKMTSLVNESEQK